MHKCICRECAVENLAGALEHRCCWEFAQANQKLMFDGSIERVLLHHTTRWFLINDKQICVDASGSTSKGQKRKRLSSSWRSIWKPVSSLYDKVSHVSQLVQRVHRLAENSGPPWSTSFLCVGTLSSTRYSTLDAILIQNYANKWPCILWLRLPIFLFKFKWSFTYKLTGAQPMNIFSFKVSFLVSKTRSGVIM